MGCRHGNIVYADIGKTSRDSVWKKRISMETGVGSCGLFTIDYMEWIQR